MNVRKSSVDTLIPNDTLIPTIDPTTARTGKWTADEDIKLKDAVQTYSGKNWVAIAVLVPGRTRLQCHNRWHTSLVYSIDQVTGRKGQWTADEDSKLKDAVETHCTRIGVQYPRWYPVDRKNGVGADGRMS
jgi:hypothetical protein